MTAFEKIREALETAWKCSRDPSECGCMLSKDEYDQALAALDRLKAEVRREAQEELIKQWEKDNLEFGLGQIATMVELDNRLKMQTARELLTKPEGGNDEA